VSGIERAIDSVIDGQKNRIAELEAELKKTKAELQRAKNGEAEKLESEVAKLRKRAISFATVKFLLDRTDFSEPWCGIGFATTVKDHLERMVIESEAGP